MRQPDYWGSCVPESAACHMTGWSRVHFSGVGPALGVRSWRTGRTGCCALAGGWCSATSPSPSLVWPCCIGPALGARPTCTQLAACLLSAWLCSPAHVQPPPGCTQAAYPLRCRPPPPTRLAYTTQPCLLPTLNATKAGAAWSCDLPGQALQTRACAGARAFMDHVLGWRLLYRTAEELVAIVTKSSFGKNGTPSGPHAPAAHATQQGCRAPALVWRHARLQGVQGCCSCLGPPGSAHAPVWRHARGLMGVRAAAGCHIFTDFGGNETQLMVIAVKNGGARAPQAPAQPRL